MDIQTYSAIISAISLIGMCVGLLFGLQRLNLLYKKANNQYTWTKREKALGYSLTQSAQHLQSRVTLERQFGNFFDKTEPLNTEIIDAACKEHPDILTHIRVILGHWENMALAIHVDICDEDVCYEMVGSTIIQTVRVFRNHIDRIRDKNKEAYKYLLELARHWDKRKSGIEVPEFSKIDIDMRPLKSTKQDKTISFRR